jgi:hypothetical protein
VSGSNFYTWRRRLGEPEEERTEEAIEFVELPAMVRGARAPIELELRGVVVRLTRGVDAEDLATVLDVIEARR